MDGPGIYKAKGTQSHFCPILASFRDYLKPSILFCKIKKLDSQQRQMVSFCLSTQTSCLFVTAWTAVLRPISLVLAPHIRLPLTGNVCQRQRSREGQGLDWILPPWTLMISKRSSKFYTLHFQPQIIYFCYLKIYIHKYKTEYYQ